MAPLESLITDLGWDFIGQLPPVLRDDPEYRAVMHCAAKECERLEAAILSVRDEAIPQRATGQGLTYWEQLLRLRVREGEGAVVRVRAIMGRLVALSTVTPAGASWIQRCSDRLAGAPWAYEEHVPGDGSTPDAQVLRITLPFTDGSPSYVRATEIFREETPSELDLDFRSSDAFTLDVDQLDVGTLGV